MEIIDTIVEIDTNPYVLTTYQENDYVLRRYPPTKIGTENPHKYGFWWRGPLRKSDRSTTVPEETCWIRHIIQYETWSNDLYQTKRCVYVG